MKDVGDIESIMYLSNHNLNIPKNEIISEAKIDGNEINHGNFSKKNKDSSIRTHTISSNEQEELIKFDSSKDELNKTYFNNDISDQGLITQRDPPSDDEPHEFHQNSALRGEEYLNFDENEDIDAFQKASNKILNQNNSLRKVIHNNIKNI